MEKQKNKLTIYLIKEKINEFSDIIDKCDDEIKLDENNYIYLNNSTSRPPSWSKSFFKERLNNKNLLNSNSRVVLLSRINVTPEVTRIFAAIFGYGKNLLKDNVIEDRFGLKVALNLATSNSIKKIKKVRIGGNQKLSSEQMPSKSSLTDFDIEKDGDLINSLTITSNDETYVKNFVTGSDSLSLSADVNISTIKEFYVKTYEKYISDSYKTNFELIDYISFIKDSSLEEELDNLLLNSLNNKDNHFSMAIPTIIEWENIKCFHYFNSEEFDDIYLDKVIESLKTPILKIEQLKNKQIVCIGSLNDSQIAKWSAYKCLYGEIEYNGNSYCINNGKWYVVNQDYVKKINEEYKNTKISDIKFDTYTSKNINENSYTNSFVKNHSNDYLSLDTKVINYGGGHSKIEICDILSRNKKIIHIKPYSGSATLSHLFNQGAVSAELLLDSKFLLEVNEKIKKLSKETNLNNSDQFEIVDARSYEIVFGIISKNKDPLPNIPFFSKISFCNTKRKLSNLQFNFSIINIFKE